MTQLNVQELRLKLETLERQLQEAQATKKRDMKLKNDEIKEIRDEITLVLTNLDDINSINP